tara:strand:+ start:12 stop:953 length:942 start_codon:yes stop_codon:yes gene_type:complete
VIKIKKIFILFLICLASLSKVNAEIKDSLFITVGDRAITQSDIVDEIKIILILSNMSYSEDKRDQLQQMAVKSTIERTVKKIEISKNPFLEFSQEDLRRELVRLASRINMDVETLKNVATSNGLDFSIIENQIKTELLWNSLIFHIYKGRLSINLEEIEEQLIKDQNKKEFEEYLISEILIKSVAKEELDKKINEIKDKIKIEGFENIAMKLSISKSSVNGGDLGWLHENEISNKFKSKIFNTTVGNISEPILLNEGILIFKVRDKRKVKNLMSLDERKNQLVMAEKGKILNMYSRSHYDNLRRTVATKFFNE